MTQTLAISPQVEVLLLYKPREDLSFLASQVKGKKILILEEKKEDLIEAKKWGKVFPLVEYYSLEDPKQVLKKILWRFLLQKKALHTLGQKSPFFYELQKQMEELSQGIELVASEIGDMGKSLFQNVLSNFTQLTRYVLRKEYKGAFPQVPAYILGAGPSLSQEKLKGNALLFAAGTALEALDKFKVTPHFAASVDKEASASIFEDSKIKETILFFQLRTSPQIVKKPFSQKILCPDHLYYPFQNPFYQALDSIEEMDSGWNVATFLLQQALYMGCSPIYLGGMDFCFSSKAYYAHKKGAIPKNSLIETKNQKGEKVYTKKDLLQAKNWVEDLCKKYPGRIFNISEKGLKIEGAPLQEPKPFSDSGDLKSRLKTLGKEKKPSLQLKKQVLGTWEKSFTNCLHLTRRSLAFFEKNFERLLQKKQFFSYFLQASFAKEVAYTHYLHFFWETFKPALLQKTTDQAPLFLQEWLQKLLFFQENGSFLQKRLKKELQELAPFL